VLAILVLTVGPHFSHRGVQNRTAALRAWVLVVALTSSAAAGLNLDIDTDELPAGARWCWLEHADMSILAAARATRCRLSAAIIALVGMEVAW
jgi:hypothetical protein